jgi:CubicO group peptidase (beta-lactamase class C family)
MSTEQKTDRLTRMMRTYEGAHHTVIGFHVQHGDAKVVRAGAGLPEVPQDRLIFEIGSLTKVFAAILLCLQVEEGKVDATAPVSEMSDQLSHVPDWITPERLVAHISGLPVIHMPLWKALLNQHPKGPYTTFSRADLLAWMRDWPSKDPGPKPRHRYSNLGYGLLGEALALNAGQPFVELLADKVTGPLGMIDTTSDLDGAQQDRFVQPRSPNGKAVEAWVFQAIAAAGCLRSSAADLIQFARRAIEALNAPESPLDRAICRSVVPILGLSPRGALEPTAQCWGWRAIRMGKTDPAYVYHDGGTAGSTCALYVCGETKEALGILSNNGIGGNLWGSTKLSWSNQLRQAQEHFAAR